MFLMRFYIRFNTCSYVIRALSSGSTIITSLKLVKMSLHLLRIVTSVIPARFDISTCRIWMPSSTTC